MKVMVILGTRPEIIRLSEVLKKINDHFELILVHTGQNYDRTLNEVFFEEFCIPKPNFYLDAVGENLGETIGNIISSSYSLMLKEKPDALLILGDTNSGLSVISAKRLKIPIFHMEAGNRCFDQNVPEEINRKLIDHISDINLTYTQNAKTYLVHEGLKNDTIYCTGSPLTEVLELNRSKIESSLILEKLELEKKSYFVVSLHREENLDIGGNFLSLIKSLNYIAETHKMPMIFSVHPRTRHKISGLDFELNDLIILMEPFGFFDYIKLQKNAYCVLSDSGSIAEEASILKFPAVSIRTSCERPEALEAGAIVLGGISSDSISSAIQIAEQSSRLVKQVDVKDYLDTNISDKVVRIIRSYTDIVNTRIWRK